MQKGKYIVRMDADDWSYPDRLQKQYEFMQNNPDIGVSGGAIDVCNESLLVQNIRRYPLTDKLIREIIFYIAHLHTQLQFGNLN